MHLSLGRIALIVAVVVASVSTACSASTEGLTLADEATSAATSTEVDQTGGDDQDELPEAAGFSVLEALRRIPASAADDASASFQVVAADLVIAGDQAGLTHPGATTDPDELLAFYGPMTGIRRDDRPLRMFVPLPRILIDRSIGMADEFDAELGFSPGEITSYVGLESPPAQFVTVTGVSLTEGLPEVVPGVRTLGEGEDFEPNLETRSVARPLGRPLRLAEQDGQVAMSLATMPVIDWLTGPTAGTLADDPALASLATRLDAQSVVSAALVLLEDEPYLGVGLGWSADDSGARGTLVFAYDSAESAEAELSRIEASFAMDSLVTRQPISDRVTLESIEVRDSEVVAVVRFPDDSIPSSTWQMLLSRDGPFGQQVGG